MFKQKYSFEEREKEYKRIKLKYPDKIPIIINQPSNNKLPKLQKIKYLVPDDLTMGQFLLIIRKRMKLNSDKAIFLFINNTIPPNSELISIIQHDCCDKDGFLYINVIGESTFG
jgi:GABA(A) receptor-associated protein